MQLQKHPNKLIISLKKCSHFEQNNVVVCLSYFSHLPYLLIHPLQLTLFVALSFYLLFPYLLLQSDNKVFNRTRNQIVGAKYLLKSISKLSVKFKQVKYLFLRMSTHLLNEQSLRQNKTDLFHPFVILILLYFLRTVTSFDIVIKFANNRPLQCIFLELIFRNIASKRVNHFMLQLLLCYRVE